MAGFLTPYWEHPACTKCAHCDEPIELIWSSSAVGQKLIHGSCYMRWKIDNPTDSESARKETEPKR